MHRKHGKRSERGVVLVVVLICLMLLFTIAVLMMLNASTESSLNANYRSSTRVFYAALGGLEEARGRMWTHHPSAFSATFVPPPGTTMPVGSVSYVINQGSGPAVNPTDLSWNNPYGDFEYQQEFNAATNVQNANSIYSSGSPPAGLDGPLFKWVRITPVTEKFLNIDINSDNFLDPNTPLYFDGAHLNLTSNGFQAFELTALAVLPDNSRKMLQYVVAPAPLNLSFPAALTLNGSSVSKFDVHSSTSYKMDGRDQDNGGVCTPKLPDQYAVGVIPSVNVPSFQGSIPSSARVNYLGLGYQPGPPATPSVGDVSGSLIPAFQTISALDGPNGLVQTITQNADYTVQGPATSLPDYGSATSPVTTVVQGDLTLSQNVNGYGLLLVTGNLAVTGGNFVWKGIVLVIGQGWLWVPASGNAEFDGAVLLAKTRDSYNNLLSGPAPGPVYFDWDQGNGVFYNSCWINQVQSSFRFHVLSFREIPQ